MYAKKKYRKGGGLEEMLAKYMRGGMIYAENGDQMPEGETFVLNNKTAKDPGFQEWLKSTSSTYYPMSIARADFGAGAVRGVDEPIGIAEYARFLRSDESRGVPLAVSPDTFDFEAIANDPQFNQRIGAGEMPGDPLGKSIDSRSPTSRYQTGVKRYENFPTFAEVAKQQVSRYESNKDLERRYNEYLMKQRQPQRVGPRESVEYTPSGLTAAERRLRDSFNQ